jgi:hypothetical protein
VDDPLRTLFAVGSAMTWPALGTLALGGALLLIALHRNALAKALDTAPVVRCGELVTGSAPSKQVIVTGHVRPDRNGGPAAPVTGEQCAWYRVEVWQNPGSRGQTARYRWDSGGHFTVGDATGEVQVAARLIDRHLHEDDITAGLAAGLLEWHVLPDGRHQEVIARLKRAGMPIRSRRWGDYHRITEYRLPADRAITVLGRPRSTGRGMALTRTNSACGVSERTVDHLRAAAHATAADTRSLPRLLLCAGAALLALGLLLRLPYWLVGTG